MGYLSERVLRQWTATRSQVEADQGYIAKTVATTATNPHIRLVSESSRSWSARRIRKLGPFEEPPPERVPTHGAAKLDPESLHRAAGPRPLEEQLHVFLRHRGTHERGHLLAQCQLHQLEREPADGHTLHPPVPAEPQVNPLAHEQGDQRVGALPRGIPEH